MSDTGQTGQTGQTGALDRALRSLLGYRMKRAFLVINADLTAVLTRFDLRIRTFSALVVICDNPDVTQSQLGAALSIERSNVVLIIDELESRELITRNKAPADRRIYALRATLAGMRLRDEAMAAVEAHEDRLLGRLSDGERDCALTLLNLIEASAADASVAAAATKGRGRD